MFKRLRGYRTLCVFSPIFILALLDGLQAIDITPILVWLHVSDINRPTILCAISLAAMAMRAWTTTPVGRRDDGDR